MMNLKNCSISKEGSKKAEKVKEFIEGLKHSKGEYAGTNFILKKWQYKDIIEPLYGTLNSNGTRQYRICLIEVAKKNGKTTLAAALALYHLFADEEKGGEIYMVALLKIYQIVQKLEECISELKGYTTLVQSMLKVVKIELI